VLFFRAKTFLWVVQGVDNGWLRKAAAWLSVMVFVAGASVICLAVEGVIHAVMR
jgi:hypothetical protein